MLYLGVTLTRRGPSYGYSAAVSTNYRGSHRSTLIVCSGRDKDRTNKCIRRSLYIYIYIYIYDDVRSIVDYSLVCDVG